MSKPYIDDLIGIPFKNYGRDNSGCDCWGLVKLVFERFGVNVPNYSISCFAPVEIHEQIVTDMPFWEEIKQTGPDKGGQIDAPALVVMAMLPEAPKICNHLGVYIGFGKFIHTTIKTSSSLQRIDHPFFSKRIRGFYRYVG